MSGGGIEREREGAWEQGREGNFKGGSIFTNQPFPNRPLPLRLGAYRDTLIMLTLWRAEGCEFDPRPGQYSRMSFSSDQVTGTVFPHLNMPFLPNSKFI